MNKLPPPSFYCKVSNGKAGSEVKLADESFLLKPSSKPASARPEVVTEKVDEDGEESEERVKEMESFPVWSDVSLRLPLLLWLLWSDAIRNT